MKKILTTILILLYVTATMETTLHMHYCMGEVRSWKLWAAPANGPACQVCGMTQKKGCCEDRPVVIKAEQKHSIPSWPVRDLKPVESTPPPLYRGGRPVFSLPFTASRSSSHAPPGESAIPLFIRHCRYRI